MLSFHIGIKQQKRQLRKPLTQDNKLLESNFITLVDIQPSLVKDNFPTISYQDKNNIHKLTGYIIYICTS